MVLFYYTRQHFTPLNKMNVLMRYRGKTDFIERKGPEESRNKIQRIDTLVISKLLSLLAERQNHRKIID